MPERETRVLGLDRKEFAVLAAWFGMVCFALLHYQPWEDEGRAWMDARNCSLYELTFHVLRYEGHPALWYWILWPVSHLHVPFGAINWIAAAFAGCAVYMLLRLAPFPFYLRALLPFSFTLGYGYAVVGRSYAVFALLGFWVAHLFRQKTPRPLAMAVALSLLANLTLHGAIVACCFGAAYVWRHRGAWPTTTWVRPAAIFAGSLAFVAVCVWPVRQVDAPVNPMVKKLLPHIEPVSWSRAADAQVAVAPTPQLTPPPTPPPTPPQMGGTGGIPFRQRVRFAVVYPVATWTVLALPFELLMCIYVYRRRAALLIAAPVLLCCFLVAVYLKLWHTGLVWVTLAMMLWAVWDEAEPARTLSLQNAVAAYFSLLCVLQLPWTLGAIRYERTHATYPSKAAAVYLKTLPKSTRVDGYGLAFTVLPYFSRSVFANSVGPYSEIPDPLPGNPDQIVVGLAGLHDDIEAHLLARGYSRTHTFCGAQYFPNQTIVPTCMAVLERR